MKKINAIILIFLYFFYGCAPYSSKEAEITNVSCPKILFATEHKNYIDDIEKLVVERINISGNNITREDVIRNNLILDEGDSFNNILYNKSINNLKVLNFFKNVESEVVDGSDQNKKIINIELEEKPPNIIE